MASMREYFELTSYKPKYQVGTRIYAKWNKIPFVGTIYNDSLVSEVDGPKLSIHLDLPLNYQDKIFTMLNVKFNTVKDIKVLKELQ
jgi:hypothetical protein